MLSRTPITCLARALRRAGGVSSPASLRRRYRLTSMPLAYVGSTNEWDSAVATAGCGHAFFADLREANEEKSPTFSLLAANPSSIRTVSRSRAANARAVRTALDAEMWDVINGAWLELKRSATARRSREELTASCAGCRRRRSRFDGSAYRTMLRNDAYWFSRLGLYVERADNTARILDVKYHLLLPATEPVGGPLDYLHGPAILSSVLGTHSLSLGLSRERPNRGWSPTC